jgi:transposase InsO family protein
MNETKWTDLDEHHLEAWQQRVELVETLLDECIHETERAEIRRAYIRQHGVSERTIRNYLRRYREHGGEGLLFHRSRRGTRSPRIHDAELRHKLLALIEEHPHRTVPQLRRILTKDADYTQAISAVSDRSIYRFLAEHGLTQKQRAAKAIDPARRSYRQFEAAASMELVQGDARDGIWLPDPENPEKTRKTYLFGWVDDYSRKILFARYYWDEKLPRLEDSFKTMVLRWGIPKKAYLDNGSAYIAGQFAFVLSRLHIRKIHHKPYQAWCKGKIESIMKTLKNEFQSEAQRAGFRTLEELNSALWAWIDVEYNRRNHSSTGQPPNARFADALPADHRRIEHLEWFESLFLVPATRTVHKYGLIKLEGNKYRTKATHGTVIEVRYTPFDLSTVWRYEGDACVETLAVHILNNPVADRLPEEHDGPASEVSQASSRYFTELRERHTHIRNAEAAPRYSRLAGGGHA